MTTVLTKIRYSTYLSPGQTDSQVGENQRKFAKPELEYGLAKQGWPHGFISRLTSGKKP